MLLRILTVLLCFLFLMPVITSCSDRALDESVENESISEETQTEDTEIPDNLPESNFDGYTFRVLTINDSIGIEEADGEILNDVEYERDIAMKNVLM